MIKLRTFSKDIEVEIKWSSSAYKNQEFRFLNVKEDYSWIYYPLSKEIIG